MNISIGNCLKVIKAYDYNNCFSLNDKKVYNWIKNNKSKFTKMYLNHVEDIDDLSEINYSIDISYAKYLVKSDVEYYDKIHDSSRLYELYGKSCGFDYYYNKPSFAKYVKDLTINDISKLTTKNFKIYIEHHNMYNTTQYNQYISLFDENNEKLEILLKNFLISKNYFIRYRKNDEYYGLLVKYNICDKETAKKYKNPDAYKPKPKPNTFTTAYELIDKKIQEYEDIKNIIRRIENNDYDDIKLSKKQWEFVNTKNYNELSRQLMLNIECEE